jgi:hypothetical protein
MDIHSGKFPKATMNAITFNLYQKGMAEDVFAMKITRTRSNE